MLEPKEINTNNSLLALNDIEKLSKSFTEILYNTIHTRTVYENTERLNTLLVLQKYYSSSLINHVRVNTTNYRRFLEAIKTTSEQEYQSLPTVDVTKSITDYFERLAQIQQLRQRHLDMITDRTRRNCAVPNFMYKKRNIYDCLDDLRLIQKQAGAIGIDNSPNPVVHKTPKPSLAYALLNLKDTKADRLLCSILQQWSTGQLDEERAAFVDYLWEHLDRVSNNVVNILLDNFKFMLEKSIIETCTGILRSGDSALTSNVKRIFHFCTKNDKLGCIVKTLLYTLYASSGFNITLLKLIERLEFLQG